MIKHSNLEGFTFELELRQGYQLDISNVSGYNKQNPKSQELNTVTVYFLFTQITVRTPGQQASPIRLFMDLKASASGSAITENHC